MPLNATILENEISLASKSKALRPGDIHAELIYLIKSLITANKIPMFLGKLGQRNGALALQLTERIERSNSMSSVVDEDE